MRKATGSYRTYKSLEKLQTKEEAKKLAGPLAEKELPAEGYPRRNGKWEESSRQKKITDDRQHYDKWTV